ncbi:Xaa-Pro aminopeptidase [Scopulibacillus darangshiensis]|uniref:Xaa-Pro aminopeptidase n=1 Tax=Scopulibacillus darangshiensis TaxID=442528 RepID=A0A4R2PAQ8_9BACL|nr:Xaa-Pro peptidase family protein [Scopulibacillus darangshiensis]TCP32072.1 Xaa-Pro aminopeptidase [Scopulibacillus darangshiensis]
MTERIGHVEKWLQTNNLAFAFISEPKNVFYFTKFMCEPHERLLGLFIFPEVEPFLVCPKMEAGQAKAAGWCHEIIGYQDHEDPWELIHRVMKDKEFSGKQKAAIESATLPYQKALSLQKFNDRLMFEPIDAFLGSLRTIKDEQELTTLKKAAELADYAVSVGVNAIKKGRTEQAIIAEIEYELTKRGYPEMAFDTMVLAGENSAAPHGNPGKRQIKEGDFVLFDLGVVVDGYCSDITRTVCYKHASDEQAEIYDTVLQAETEAIKASRAGLRIGDLDRIARNIITDKGYGDYFPHRLGHGLGLGAHEAPSMSENNDDVLKTGMVYTIEPGIYVPDVGGVRIEDDVYLSEQGPVTLTNYPKTLQIIP